MRYYVYVYYDGESPIYVGKGQGRRAWCHVEGRGKFNQDLHRFARTLGSIEPVFVLRTDDEVEAYAHERALIAAIGRRDLGTGTLFNRCEGMQKNPSSRVLGRAREVFQRSKGFSFGRSKIRDWIEANSLLLDDPTFIQRKIIDDIERNKRRVEHLKVRASSMGITSIRERDMLVAAGCFLEKWRERVVKCGRKVWTTHWRIVGTGRPFARVRRGFGEFC